MFCADRDLLPFEPMLFRDVGWAAQRLADGLGTLTGGILTLPTADFVAAGVRPGMVALAAGVPLEIIAVPTATTLSLSRLRADPADPAINPSPFLSPTSVVVHSFAPQIAVAHAHVLAMLGLGPAWARPGEPEPTVTNPESLRRIEAIDALHVIFAAAAGIGPPDASLAHRAAHYRALFSAARARAVAHLDTTGDGLANAVRHLHTAMLSRF